MLTEKNTNKVLSISYCLKTEKLANYFPFILKYDIKNYGKPCSATDYGLIQEFGSFGSFFTPELACSSLKIDATMEVIGVTMFDYEKIMYRRGSDTFSFEDIKGSSEVE